MRPGHGRTGPEPAVCARQAQRQRRAVAARRLEVFVQAGRAGGDGWPKTGLYQALTALEVPLALLGSVCAAD